MTYTITQISQAKKNSERVNIYLNGKFWIGLSKNDLISQKLVTGQQLDDLQKQEIEKTALNSKLIDKALRYLQIRPRSIGEIREYLVLKKQIPAEEAENIIAYLVEKDYLSDERFAQWYTEYKLQSGVNGINKIKAELMKKHVATEIIKWVVEEKTTDSEFRQQQLTQIEEYAKKILRTIKAKDQYELKAKLTNRLLSRGFGFDDIIKVIKAILL